MSNIEQIITQIVNQSVTQAIEPLIVQIEALQKVVTAQSDPANEPYLQLKDLAVKLGCSVTKLKLFRNSHPDAPKPNPMGLYDLSEWRDYLKGTTL
jgi:hypothetical protein